MAQQQPEKDNDKLLPRLKTKSKKQQFTALSDYPAERCLKPPERVDMPLSMKFVKKRRINMKRKYRAVLENGIFQLHNPKQTDPNAFSIEYRIDLAKVILLYDNKRLAVQLQKEGLLLYPINMSLEKFRLLMHQHRLWSQQKAAEAEKAAVPKSDDDPAPRSPEPRSAATPQLDSSERNSNRTPKTTTSTVTVSHLSLDFLTDPTISSVYSNPMYEYLRAVHATQLAVLDTMTRNLQEQINLAEDMMELKEHMKKTRPAVQEPPKEAEKKPEDEGEDEEVEDEDEDEEDEEEENETTAILPTTAAEEK